MNAFRTIEDRLREEYSRLLPEVRRVADFLEAEVRHRLLPITLHLADHERMMIRSRIKECESALDSLRRRQETGTFDRDQPTAYTLTALPDLAGVRVLAFPSKRLVESGRELRRRFPSWEADPVRGPAESAGPLALKYNGYCEASSQIRGEIQVVPILVGLFWEVEHAAIYKPSPRLRGIDRSMAMKQRTLDVYAALQAFEREFESLIESRNL
jgi:hypothetical protein